MIDLLIGRVQRAEAAPHIHKLFIKIRFADFRQTTVECVAATIDRTVFHGLLETGFQRRQQAVRLLGAGVRLIEEEAGGDSQLGLFDLDAVA